MALLSSSHPSSLFLPINPTKSLSPSPPPPLSPPPFLRFSSSKTLVKPFLSAPKTGSRRRQLPHASVSEPTPDPDPTKKPSADEWGETSASITDEWGEKGEPESEPKYRKGLDSDPPKDEDEWEEEQLGGGGGNGSTAGAQRDEGLKAGDKEMDLKRALVDTVYGSDFGFRASQEVRAEVSELVNQLEALNPTPAPVDAAGLLDGKWVLVYTAFSELLPLLAAGTTPLLKLEEISQAIDSSNLSIVNSTILSSPFATFSFSASATFEVRSPSRIQVEFKEGSFQPPEIKSRIDLPENLNLFGQKISLLPVQQSLTPLQELVANISRTISGQPPLKVPIPGNRSKSWLLITYLDEDLRISRGDGGLFVLVKEGSRLLCQ